MAKIILLALAVYLFIYIVKRYQRNMQNPTAKPTGNQSASESNASENIVQCKTCGLYLPSKESIIWQQQHYCCQAHLPNNTPKP